MNPPVIIVSLVHIHGPLKGEIQEFGSESITIGRHPSNDVHFPTDLNTVSRKHAQIVREGNRFRLVDKSSNGTFVNGKRITETILKDGDVIEFAEGGPKVSFLTEMRETGPESVTRPEYGTGHGDAASAGIVDDERVERPAESAGTTVAAEPPRQEQPSSYMPPVIRDEGVEVRPERMAAPLVIQYGPSVRSYREVPVVIGRHPGCGFILENTGILNEHAEIFFAQNRYWIKDLTGQSVLRINQQPIAGQAALAVNDVIALTAMGPAFRFVGEGRLAEEEAPPSEKTNEAGGPGGAKQPSTGPVSPGSRDKDNPKAGIFAKMKKKLF